MKTKVGSLTGLVNSTNFWWINEEKKFKQPRRRWPSGVGVGHRKQMLSSWHLTERTQEQGILQATMKTWQSLASPTRSLSGDSLFEVIPMAGGPGPQSPGHQQLAVISYRHNKVLLEGTQLPLHLCHWDTNSNAEAIKTILKNWVLCQKFWKLFWKQISRDS